ncbi:aminotransferase class IV [Blastococcus sp. SYSU DS0510]
MCHLNGEPATADDLAPVAFSGYAHFTAMQVRDGRIRALDLHLERLRTATAVMFGRALDVERVRALVRAAVLAGPRDVSLTATAFTSDGEFTVGGDGGGVDLLVRTGPPASGPVGPLALDVVEHERGLPHVKHVGEVAKTWFLRRAVDRGYHDAVFVDRQGRLSEATIWNLAFWNGTTVIWPVADMLIGTTMQALRRQLANRGIPQCEDPSDGRTSGRCQEPWS